MSPEQVGEMRVRDVRFPARVIEVLMNAGLYDDRKVIELATPEARTHIGEEVEQQIAATLRPMYSPQVWG